MRIIFRYLKMDMYRAFVNIKFVAAIIVIAFLPFFARAEQQGYSFINVFSANSIFEYYGEVTFWSELGILNFIIISFVYADCLCDDLSHGNHIYALTRGNLNGYIISKIITVFFNSIVTFCIGMMLFAGVSNILLGFEWEVTGGENTNEYLYSNMATNAFDGMLEEKKYLLFFICCLCIQSILYGITSLGSLLMSLYIKNKLLILCVPVLLITVGNYGLTYVIPNYGGYKNVYSVDFFYMRDTVKALLMLSLGTSIIIGTITVLIRRKMRRIAIE